MSDKYKTYLGDSVYADFNDCGQIVLTTENGYGPTNTIFLEPEVLEALQRWHKELLKILGERAAAK